MVAERRFESQVPDQRQKLKLRKSCEDKCSHVSFANAKAVMMALLIQIVRI
jgi:hypothetical protein